MSALRLLLAAATVGALALPAYAAEGNGDPVPGPNVTVGSTVQSAQPTRPARSHHSRVRRPHRSSHAAAPQS